jgi:hypothetical protein
MVYTNIHTNIHAGAFVEAADPGMIAEAINSALAETEAHWSLQQV